MTFGSLDTPCFRVQRVEWSVPDAEFVCTSFEDVTLTEQPRLDKLEDLDLYKSAGWRLTYERHWKERPV